MCTAAVTMGPRNWLWPIWDQHKMLLPSIHQWMIAFVRGHGNFTWEPSFKHIQSPRVTGKQIVQEPSKWIVVKCSDFKFGELVTPAINILFSRRCFIARVVNPRLEFENLNYQLDAVCLVCDTLVRFFPFSDWLWRFCDWLTRFQHCWLSL